MSPRPRTDPKTDTDRAPKKRTPRSDRTGRAKGAKTGSSRTLTIGIVTLVVANILGVVYGILNESRDRDARRDAVGPPRSRADYERRARLERTLESLPHGGRAERRARRVPHHRGHSEPRPQLAEPRVHREVAQPQRDSELALRGQLIDLNAQPLPQLAVLLDSDFGSMAGEAVTTDASGSFRLGLRVGVDHVPALLMASKPWLSLEGDAYTILLHPTITMDGLDEPCRAIAAPCRSVRGSVRDHHGRPIAHARIRISLPDEIAHQWRDNLNTVGRVENRWSASRVNGTESLWDGTFLLPKVPDVDGLEILVHHGRFLPYRDRVEGSDIAVTLEPIE